LIVPWTTANGISISYQLAGDKGPVVVLLHEMGGTLDSWDAVAPGLAENYRVLRYDQRGAGLTEKVRQEYSNEDAVNDLEGVLANLKLAPPYNFVCVAPPARKCCASSSVTPTRCSQSYFAIPRRALTRAAPGLSSSAPSRPKNWAWPA